MRKIILISAMLLAGFTACAKKTMLKFTNPIAVDRPDETIVLSRSEIEKRIGLIPDGFAPVLKLNGHQIPSQADDLDKDGKWDELAFIIDLKASQSLSLEVEKVHESAYPEFE